VKKFFPKTLTGQLILLLLLALVATHAITFFIFADERLAAVRTTAREQIAFRTASIIRLLNDTPPELHQRIVDSASSSRLRFELSDTPSIDDGFQDATSAAIRGMLARSLRGDVREVRVEISERPFSFAQPRFPSWMARHHRGVEDDDDDDDGRSRDRRYRRTPPRIIELRIAAQTLTGPWINVATLSPVAPPRFGWSAMVSVAATGILMMLIVILVVRRVARPMARLAEASEQLGRGETVAGLPEEGPADVRNTTRAFNQMNDRLQRFVRDRTLLLAAISHDLRSPITSLRLRAEMIEDAETREHMIETLREMQELVEATLSFARDDAAKEETRVVDVAALVESLAQDLQDQGLNIQTGDMPPTPYRCRGTALKRALRNLMENAARYGERAMIALSKTADGIVITVEDDGPGIPEADLDRVFDPFVRLETSRSAETGGVGLGLAIARSIARAHGGDITLANRPEGGLRAEIRLPAV